ncbi:MAG: hypothetical protein ABWZ57_06045 [Mesorhizobium sp.]|jgi:hypothetical protein
MLIIILGACLIIAGLLLLAREALDRGRLSGTAGEPLSRPRDGTLEPQVRGMRFLGIAGSWPGIAMMVVGAALLLIAPAV